MELCFVAIDKVFIVYINIYIYIQWDYIAIRYDVMPMAILILLPKMSQNKGIPPASMSLQSLEWLAYDQNIVITRFQHYKNLHGNQVDISHMEVT